MAASSEMRCGLGSHAGPFGEERHTFCKEQIQKDFSERWPAVAHAAGKTITIDTIDSRNGGPTHANGTSGNDVIRATTDGATENQIHIHAGSGNDSIVMSKPGRREPRNSSDLS
ncbi:hypothetical protein [Paracoccus mutanolyticus]|uniref:hypothetical protein n=1 Tax=Paracoccus mutanolyticus TaxID=1499308 RepID=UPI001679DAD3|nr:hypothetical protein [Paracoccus mutanolyticus]